MMYRGFAALVFVVALLGACSAQPGAPSASPTASLPAATSGGTVTFDVASSSFGDHLVGSDDHALYVLANDSANTSTCSGGCATTWPPVTVGPGQTPVGGPGVTAQLGTITRADGSIQVTAHGMPLYAYSGDSAAADINGQGKGGVWFLAAPDGGALGGEAITTPVPCACTATPPPPTPAASDPYGGGYGGY